MNIRIAKLRESLRNVLARSSSQHVMAVVLGVLAKFILNRPTPQTLNRKLNPKLNPLNYIHSNPEVEARSIRLFHV